MKQQSDELVRFISRTFLAAGIAILVGVSVLLGMAYQRNRDEALARHSRNVSRLAREIEIAALRNAVSDPLSIARLDSLRRLTADFPAQHERAERIAAGFARVDAASGIRAISADIAALLFMVERLYDERTEAAHRLDRVFIASTVLAIALLLVTLSLVRARLLGQTQEMERAVDDLQASEARFRTLVHSLHDVVFTLGHEKRYTGMYGGRASQEPGAYAQYLGRTAADVLGTEAGKVHMDAAERALNGETVAYEWSYDIVTPPRFYANTVSPLRGPDGEIRGVVGINRDVTDQATREKALADAREQLRQAQRLEALGQLAGGVAHDFNNLLTVIMTYAAILEEETARGSDAARSIDEIRLATERAAALTRQLLAFGRRQMLQPRAMDLNETVREVERMLRRLLPPDITLETSLAPSLGLVMVDPGQVEQVLINLAINARDAMPDGGRLAIDTANAHESVLVTVSDTGTGMSPETMAKIFDPFFTTKDVGKGTGLGLATVHGIVEQSGGSVNVESTLGRGTTFYLRLPRHAATGVPAAVAPPPEPTGGLRGCERIMLVDDNEELRRVVKRMLSRAGYEVLEASSGAAALAQLDRGIGVHVVLSDVMMPEMNGRAVMEAIRQRHRDVRLLLMSGYSYDTALRGMAQRGDVAFIEKPFTAGQLLRRLREVLEQTPNRGAA